MSDQDSVIIYVAAKRIANELPNIVGKKNWSKFNQNFSNLITQFDNAQNDLERASQAEAIEDLFLDYDSADRRLTQEIYIISDLADQNDAKLQAIATEIGIDSTSVRLTFLFSLQAMDWSVDEATLPDISNMDRHINTPQGGRGGAKSVKLRNFKYETATLLEIGGRALLGAGAFMAAPHIYILVGGALIMAMPLSKSITRDINEQDASVFWGFIVACSHKNPQIATKERVQEVIKEQRRKFGLAELSENQIDASIRALKDLGAIAPIPGKADTWQIVERFSIQS
ncbi:MAG: hypothetical protein F9K27_12410 [Anaerolineae bacterium]|nr:MAG: hypothetical protein F9K27_12410 [Anaerolineae bacterium]